MKLGPKDSLARHFGEVLRRARLNAGLSQAELAERLGHASQDAITRLERGVAGSVRFDFLEAIADVLAEEGVTLADLFSQAQWLVPESQTG